MWRKKIFASAAILILALMAAFPATGLLAGEISTDTLDLSATESSVLEDYGKLPLMFIENQGQVDEAVKYYVKTSRQTVYFTEENIVFDLIRPDGAVADDTVDRLVFSLDFMGANRQHAIEGSAKDDAVVNYFIGNDPENWYANVPTYRELVYRDIYPNIDLRLYGNGGMLRYDFVVNPGATPEAIALAYNGIDSLAIIDGEIVIGTAFGDMVQSQPYIYQQIGDEVVEVEGGFRLGSDNTYGFHVAAYNNYYPLIIDPLLFHYSTYLGGLLSDVGYGIAVDSEGNAYVTGYTASANFPTQNPYQGTLLGDSDVFVTKLAQDGASLVYSTYLGSQGDEAGHDIAVDVEGHAYVTGYTTSSSPPFPTTSGALQTAHCGGRDAFVTMLSRDGDFLVYSTYLGGGDDDEGNGIALDWQNHAYVTGKTLSSYPARFPTNLGAFQTANAGGWDAFVTRLTPAGNAFVYSTYLGGSYTDEGWDIAVDVEGHAYVTGKTWFGWPDAFPTTANAFQTASAGSGDAFVTRLAPQGNVLRYSTYLGGEDIDYGYGIAVDSVGNAYVTGQTQSTDFPTQNPYQGTFAGWHDVFVTKLSGRGDFLVYSTYLGGEGADYGRGIALDSEDNAYVTGYTNSDDFPTQNAYQGTYYGHEDVFVTKLASDGNALVYSTYLGGGAEDRGRDITVDSNAHAYVTGSTQSSSFPTTPHAFQPTYAWEYIGGDFPTGCDAFVTKIMGLEDCGCFIASAAYDTPMAEEIQILRDFRDESLLTNPLGQALVDVYYRVSPPIAEFITEHPSLKSIVRAGLLPTVVMSSVAVNTTPAEEIAILALLVLVSVAVAVWATRRRGRDPEYT